MKTQTINKKHVAILAVFMICITFVLTAFLSTSPLKASADSETGVNYYVVSLPNYTAGKFEYTFGGSRVILANGQAEDIGNPYTEYGLQGYYFAGWYQDEELTTLYDFSTQATAGMAIYGGLKETSSVNFNSVTLNQNANTQTDLNGFTLYVESGSAKSNGGSIEVKKGGSIAFSIAKTQNVTITFENGGSREFTFGIDAVENNQYTVDNYKQFSKVLKTQTIGKGSMTVYDLKPGRYKLCYTGTSTWKVSGIALSVPEYKTVSFIDYKRPAIPEQTVAVGDVALKPEEVAVKGHTFLGWFTPDDQVYNFETPITDNLTLTAKYQANTYTVTFAQEGYDAISGVFGSALEEPTEPKKTGYTFAGWYQDEEFTKPFDFKTDTLQGDMTLYAAFKEDTAKEPTWLDSTFESVGLPGLTTAVQVIILVVVIAVIVRIFRRK